MGHLDGIREIFLRVSPNYQPVPPELLRALQNPLTDLGNYSIAIRRRRENPGPQYDCPRCGRVLDHRPVRVFDQGTLKGIIKGSTPARPSPGTEGVGVVPVVKEMIFFADYPLY